MGNREGKMEHSKEKECQTGQDKKDGSSQVEEEDTAQARAEAQMYEQPGLDDWRKLAVTRREELETLQQENMELHIKVFTMEEEKEQAERERDCLREVAQEAVEEAQELAKTLNNLKNEKDQREGHGGHGPGEAEGRPTGTRKRSRRDSGTREADRPNTGPSRAGRQEGGGVTQGKRAPRDPRHTGAGAGGGAGVGGRGPPRT